MNDMGHMGYDTDDMVFFSLGSNVGLGYFWTDTAFEICTPVNMMIRLFHPRDERVVWGVIHMIWGFFLHTR